MGFPDKCLLSVLLLKWNRTIEMEWAWLRRFNSIRNWVLLLSCDYVLKFDWYCQLSGSGSDSLNSRKLPGRFSYGLGTRLALNLQGQCNLQCTLERHGTTITCYQNCNCDIKGWCSVSSLWDIYVQCGQCVQQQLKFTLSTKILATKNWLTTLTTLWLPYVYFGIRDWLHKTPARQLVQISSLTILGTPTKSLQTELSWKFSCPDGYRWL